MRNLRSAWRILTADPIGVLLPTGAILMIELAVSLVLRATWTELIGWRILALAAFLQAGVLVLTLPLRAALIGAGAEVEGRPVVTTLRVPALAVVALFVASLQAVLVAACLLGGMGAVVAMATRGLYVLAAVSAGVVAVLAAVLSLLVRSVFGYAPAEAVVGQRGGFAALRYGFAGKDVVAVFLLLLAGDLALLVASACCGIGALAGYPLGELAVLHRWLERKGSS